MVFIVDTLVWKFKLRFIVRKDYLTLGKDRMQIKYDPKHSVNALIFVYVGPPMNSNFTSTPCLKLRYVTVSHRRVTGI